jgi:hypothetical protein
MSGDVFVDGQTKSEFQHSRSRSAAKDFPRPESVLRSPIAAQGRQLLTSLIVVVLGCALVTECIYAADARRRMKAAVLIW